MLSWFTACIVACGLAPPTDCSSAISPFSCSKTRESESSSIPLPIHLFGCSLMPTSLRSDSSIGAGTCLVPGAMRVVDWARAHVLRTINPLNARLWSIYQFVGHSIFMVERSFYLMTIYDYSYSKDPSQMTGGLAVQYRPLLAHEQPDYPQ